MRLNNSHRGFLAALMFHVLLAWMCFPASGWAENWPQWRGPASQGLSNEQALPIHWTQTRNVRWRTPIPGEGSSSPIVWDDHVFVTSSLDFGLRRIVHCLSRTTGEILWSRETLDEDPEITSALTGHAAATPVTDGKHVVAFFGNAGLVCYDFAGHLLWKRSFGQFESELGLASSPIIHQGNVIQLCDHDGTKFYSFDSFLIALRIADGKDVWRTERPRLFRSWSTPIIVPRNKQTDQLIVNAQDEVRSYDSQTGKQLWKVRGMTGWVTPTPVFAEGLVFATSGKDGPTLAIRPDGQGDVTESHVDWQHRKGAPYVCSPLYHDGLLYVHNEQGILHVYEAATGELQYRKRLSGKFSASAVAGDGKIYLSNEAGDTFVIQPGREFELLATNALEEECLASPAISEHCLFLRTRHHLYCIDGRIDGTTDGCTAQ